MNQNIKIFAVDLETEETSRHAARFSSNACLLLLVLEEYIYYKVVIRREISSFRIELNI